MHIQQSIFLEVPPEKVWDLVADPQRVQQWNPQLKSFTKISTGALGRGSHYEVAYEMGGGLREMTAEVMQFHRPKRLQVMYCEKHAVKATLWQRQMVEDFTLTPQEGGTLLSQEVTVENSGMPPVLRWLSNLLFAFGKPTSPRYLAQLKKIIEGDQR